MGYEVKGIKFHKGSDGPGVRCSIYRDNKRVALYYDAGDGSDPTVTGWKSMDEKAAFDAYVASWPKFPSFGGRMLAPSVDAVVAEMLVWDEIRKESKKLTLFRMGDKTYGNDEWSSLNEPYDDRVRARLEHGYNAKEFRVDLIGKMEPDRS